MHISAQTYHTCTLKASKCFCKLPTWCLLGMGWWKYVRCHDGRWKRRISETYCWDVQCTKVHSSWSRNWQGHVRGKIWTRSIFVNGRELARFLVDLPRLAIRSHYCPEKIKLAAERKVILFALPPHTTHITQPLDRGCSAPLKVAWREECH